MPTVVIFQELPWSSAAVTEALSILTLFVPNLMVPVVAAQEVAVANIATINNVKIFLITKIV